MVKRKSEFDRDEKKERARDVVRKVSKRVNLDDLSPIVEDGALLISKGSEVFFERTKESRSSVCVGVVVSIYGNGGVDVWDETHNEFFLFNWRKLAETGVKVRMQRQAQPLVHCTNEQIVELIAMVQDDGCPHAPMPDEQQSDITECIASADGVRIELEDIEARLAERYGLRGNVRALLIEMCKIGQLVEDELVADWHDAMSMRRSMLSSEGAP